MSDEGTTVGLNDVGEIRCGELSIRNPARELVVPHAVVPTEKLSVRLRQVGDLVTAREGELAARGFGSVL